MLLGGKLPENNNTYENTQKKKHFDEFTLAKRKEKKPSHFLEVFSCLKYLRTSRNKSEQVQLVCSITTSPESRVEQPLTTKTCLLPNLLPRILITLYFFRNICGVHEHSVRHTMGPGDSRQIFHVIQPARITVLISDFASPESFNAVFTGSSARRKSSSSVDKGW